MVDKRNWSPELGAEARVRDDAPGVFRGYAGKRVTIEAIDWPRREVNVTINRQPLVMAFAYLENPPDDHPDLAGEPAELLLRLSRLAGVLKKTMTTEGIEGFGDGGRWRADIVNGKLKIWEV